LVKIRNIIMHGLYNDYPKYVRSNDLFSGKDLDSLFSADILQIEPKIIKDGMVFEIKIGQEIILNKSDFNRHELMIRTHEKFGILKVDS